MVDSAAARHLWSRLEAFHAFVYFAPEPARNYVALGLQDGAGYFASRSAAMGAVEAEVVIATFFNFKPSLVRKAIPGAWDVTTPAAVLNARMDGADKALRRILGDDVDHPDLATSAALARKAAEAADGAGRPLFAAHARLPWPTEPHLAFFHAVTLLREHRGDAHVAALVLEGYDAVEALVSHVASGSLGLPADLLQSTRGWTDDEWEAGHERLRAKGSLNPDGSVALTEDGQASRQRVEDLTDAASVAPWRALGDDEAEELRVLSAPFTKTVAKAMFG